MSFESAITAINSLWWVAYFALLGYAVWDACKRLSRARQFRFVAMGIFINILSNESVPLEVRKDIAGVLNKEILGGKKCA